MSIHKLTAGSGYDYLTRQVAAMDATDKGHVGLASYYTERGETPGLWLGSGMAGIDGLDAGDVVTAEQMQALFGSGHHPLATQRLRELDKRIGRPGVPAPSVGEVRAATRLGAPFKIYTRDVSAFRIEVARRFAESNATAGLPSDWAIPADERARIRTQVAVEFFRAEHGRDPADARELAATIAKHSRPKTSAVAGFDLTFSPVKSVSTLWAVADPHVAATIERAHQAAISDALSFVEKHALYTRTGTSGVRQVNVRGLVATAFTHRDSRAGDPQLHTHVAVANKVQTLSPDGSGKWLAIDGRILFKATIAASETYNTALEKYLTAWLGVRFETCPREDARKRPLREIAGVDPALKARFSKRRTSMEARRADLAAAFQASHGRPATPVEMLKLDQQATLETREAKHEPRTLAEQRTAWRAEAIDVLGSERAVGEMVAKAINPTAPATASAGAPGAEDALVRADAAWMREAAAAVTATMEGARATWQYWHVYAEAQRRVRLTDIGPDKVDDLAQLLTLEVLENRSVSLARTPLSDPNRPAQSPQGRPEGIVEPAVLRRIDGSSVYTVAGSELFTSTRVLEAEQRLVAAAGRRNGFTVPTATVDLALLESTANGVTLNPGQATLVREMATCGARLQLAIAPAGSGKTTAMNVLAQAWTRAGGTVIGLAPSAAAAAELHKQITPNTSTHTHSAHGDPDSNRAARGHTDTLAKLVWAIGPQEQRAPSSVSSMPAWVEQIGPDTLVVIDEAGMADTVSLDTAVSYILARGGNVRLIGDDQQLAAIGAGGVLRDIRATHGALQLSELMRFTDAAEGAASLALREGRTEALGFYLDNQRVQVGDLATMTDAVFTSWRIDREAGLDALMLAPTRDLVADLNHRARSHRLREVQADQVGRVRRLADGNEASIGDLILTRSNDRRLRISATDWVKNGDRWQITAVHDGGDLTVQHTKNGRRIRLPAAYVAESTELGYACTVHTAQGVTADTTHALATGEEARQQLYTMLTRGRQANRVYLGVVGDGDPHSVIRPDLVHPRTPTEVLESILSRDTSPKSATTLAREEADVATLLGQATQRYTDALHVAAEQVLEQTRPGVVARLEEAAEQLLPGVTDEPAWHGLRAHLILLGAAGGDPSALFAAAAHERELATADDRAAVLDWRLDSSGLRSNGPGPLPWLHAAPAAITAHSDWGPYLTARADLITGLAGQVHDRATQAAGNGSHTPVWAANGTRINASTVGDIEVWRAAMQVDPDDRRPTGPAQPQKAAGTWQRRLNRHLTGNRTPALQEWRHLLASLCTSPTDGAREGDREGDREGVAPGVAGDDFTPLLAERLAAMTRAGIDARRLLETARAAGPLPDVHAAAALWWRISRHVSPAVAARLDDHDTVTITAWTGQLVDLIGAERAGRLQASSWWPALASVVDHGLQRGWPLTTILGRSIQTSSLPDDVDDCQALIWHASIALHDLPTHDPETSAYGEANSADDIAPPADLYDGYEPVFDPDIDAASTPEEGWVPVEGQVTGPAAKPDADVRANNVDDDLENESDEEIENEFEVDRALMFAKLVRDYRVISEEQLCTDADLRRQFARADAWRDCSLTRQRMLEINRLTLGYFEQQFTPDSWGRHYLADRFGIDLAEHSIGRHFHPGQAPAGWTNLVNHLRRQGVTDAEMIITGVASMTANGRLIDRFRDRVVFPITAPGSAGHGEGQGAGQGGELEILGFGGRRHPSLSDRDKNAGPKYLTPDTPLFHKGDQLFGTIDDLLEHGAIPVVVEGPMDALAVTLATAGPTSGSHLGRYVGLAPLGTALTEEQAIALARLFQATGRDPIVATDADLPGHLAAERDFWILTGVVTIPAKLEGARALLARGVPNQQPADAVGVSVTTVRKYLRGDVVVQRLEVIGQSLSSDLDGTRWPGPGPLDHRLQELASTLDRATDLVARLATRLTPEASDVGLDLEAARVRTLHTAYLATHGVRLALRDDGRARVITPGQRAPKPAGGRGRYDVGPAVRWLERLAVAEHILAGGLDDNRYATALTHEHHPPAIGLPRLHEALGRWDIQVHRTMVEQPRAVDMVLIARTQGMLAGASVALLQAAATSGALDPAYDPARAGAAITRSGEAWTDLARRWFDLTDFSVRLTPELAEAAAELRAACHELTHTADQLAPIATIATRVDLGAAMSPFAAAIHASVDVAEAAKVPLIDGTVLTGSARKLAARLREDIEQLSARGPGLGHVLGSDDHDISTWISISDIVHSRTISLPEPMLDTLRASTALTALAASGAAAAVAHIEQWIPSPRQPGLEETRPTMGAHRPTPPIPPQSATVSFTRAALP